MASSSSLQVAGLASNFDWKTFTDQIMALEHAPADRIANEKSVNEQKVTQLGNLGVKLNALKSYATTLGTAGLFGKRSATSTTSSGWAASAATDTATGSYSFQVTKLATAAKLSGAADIGAALNPTTDSVAGLTLANLPTAQAVTAGVFTVNGKQVTVALTDSLDDVFQRIATATGNDVTATYNHTTDKITLTSASTNVVLGAANDTSNFLRALKLSNNASASVTSSDRLGSVKTSATLASANLKTAITAVDGTGAGTFSLNGVSISYNVNSDTLSGVLKRINDSTAGVSAKYDSLNDKVILTNKSTGDLGVVVSETGAGLLGALGLTSGTTLTRGDNAEFTVDGGGTLTSLSNTLDETVHGLTGLSVTANSVGTQTIKVTADTTSMRSSLNSFISAFNDVQSFLDSVTKVTKDSKGKVVAAVLSSNREIQDWGRNLRNMAFASVSGLSGSVQRLYDLGIDFKAGSNELEIKDDAKLEAALSSSTSSVDEFFSKATTGFAAKFTSFLTTIGDQNDAQKTAINKTNTGLDDQIAAIERHLEQRRAIMESAFMGMETAQSKLKSQQTAVNAMFAQKNSN